MPKSVSPVADLRAALHALAGMIDGVAFELPGGAQSRRNELCKEASWGINEYLLPRLGDLDAPLVAVLIGSTGSGKSTLLNSIARQQVSIPGVVRPTTTMPIVWAHERHAVRYGDDFLAGYGSDGLPIDLEIGTEQILDGLTLIDAPDFDSVVEGHRQMADDLLAVADVVVFVTSAQRYADAVPWEFLDKARSRAVPILFVVNRIPTGSADLILDYRRLLGDKGFTLDQRFFEIAEQAIESAIGALPVSAVADLRARLNAMADTSGRSAVLEASIRGAIEELSRRTAELEGAVLNEEQEAEALRSVANETYERQIAEVSRSLASGELIRGEVLQRWQAFVGTGELIKAVGAGLSRLSAWTRRVLGGAEAGAKMRKDARSELRDVLVRRADLAASATAAAWELDPAGSELLSNRSLWRHADETEERADQAIEDWLIGLSELIEGAGESKKRTAQVASYGVNGLAIAVILGVFLQTGGLTGTEMGVAAGAAAAQQKILEHLFGSAAARSLIETARSRLEMIACGVLQEDGSRFGGIIDERIRALPESGQLRSAFSRVSDLTEAWNGV
ncbi:MAG: 50S ribosome-binding GTPase [Acidimicrobiia bacterium]|nr:50S ribosome-binding GTPase [Acidimicrobiia bacterium]